MIDHAYSLAVAGDKRALAACRYILSLYFGQEELPVALQKVAIWDAMMSFEGCVPEDRGTRQERVTRQRDDADRFMAGVECERLVRAGWKVYEAVEAVAAAYSMMSAKSIERYRRDYGRPCKSCAVLEVAVPWKVSDNRPVETRRDDDDGRSSGDTERGDRAA